MRFLRHFSTCLLALTLSVAIVGGARAADMPVKAQPAPAFFGPYNGSGYYVGVEMGGGMSNADVTGITGVNPASLVSAQGLAGVLIGYSTPMQGNQRYGFLEADLGWNNVNGNSQGFSLSGPVSIQLLAGYGAPASQLMSFLPTFGFSVPTLPTPPNGASTSNPHSYLAFGIDISDRSADFGATSNHVWQFAPLLGVGMEAQLATGGTIGARFEEVFQMNSTCVGAVCSGAANLHRVKAIYKF